MTLGGVLIDVWVGLIGAGSGGAAAAFGWLQNLTALAALNAWGENHYHKTDPVEAKLTPNLALHYSHHRLRRRQNEPSVQETRDLERYDSLPSPTLALGPILFLVLLFGHYPL